MESTLMIREILPVWLLPNISIDSGSGQSLAFIDAATTAANDWAQANGLPTLSMRFPFVEALATNGQNEVSGYRGRMEFSDPGVQAPLAPLDNTKIASFKAHMFANVPEIGVIKVIEPILSAQSDVMSGTVGTDLLDIDTREVKGGSFQTPTFEIDVQDLSAKFEITNLAAGKTAEIRQSMHSIDIIKEMALDMSDQRAQMHLITSLEFLDSFAGFPSGLALEWGILDRWKMSLAFTGDADPILTVSSFRPDGNIGQNFIWVGPGVDSSRQGEASLATWPDKPRIHNTNIVSVDRDQDQLRGFFKLEGPPINRLRFGQLAIESPIGTLVAIRSGTRPFIGEDGNVDIRLQRRTKAKDPELQNTPMQSRFLRWVNSGTSEATGTFKVRVNDYRAEAAVRNFFLATKLSDAI